MSAYCQWLLLLSADWFIPLCDIVLTVFNGSDWVNWCPMAMITGNLLALGAAPGKKIFVIVVSMQLQMSAPVIPWLLVFYQAGLRLNQVRSANVIHKIDSLYLSMESSICGSRFGMYICWKDICNLYAGVLASAGSKRRWEDLKEEAAEADSINCIAQRLAEIPSALSSKRVCRMAMVPELSDPMEEIDADVQEVSGLWQHSNQTHFTDEVMQTSACTQVSLFFRASKWTSLTLVLVLNLIMLWFACPIARPGGCRNWPLLIIVYATKSIACTSVGSFAQGLWNLSLFTAAHSRDCCADHFGFSNYGFLKFGSFLTRSSGFSV